MAESPFRFSPRPNQAHRIQWQEWGSGAFAQAERQDKPILLSISAVWCHWCHVMDETTYSDNAIITRINRDFIPVRVDNDQRPDVNLRYNMGGWPTTALLTPGGEILTGGTYINPEQMAALLSQVLDYWAANRDTIRNSLAEPPAPALSDPQQPPEQASTQTAESLEAVMESIRQQFDRAYGGLGNFPKFPQPDVWELALARFTATGDAWAAGMAVRTLDAMAGGGMYDAMAGGFFRYSTTREWTIPHYEKMLEDNAVLARLYLRAFQILGDETYRQIAEHTLQWANRSLLSPEGLWGGSQDADEEYYKLPAEEREKAKPPFADTVFHTNWNAMMISTQLLASSLINPAHYTPIALTALEALWDRMWDPAVGLHHFDDGTPQLPGLLTDIVHLSHALLDGYEFTGDAVYLERCRELFAYADRILFDGRVYLDQKKPADPLGRFRHLQQPLAENAVMARALLRFAAITEDDAASQRAVRLIQAFAPLAKEQGIFAAPWALAQDMQDAPALISTLVESSHHPATDLRRAVFGVFDRRRAVRSVVLGSPEFLRSGYPEIPLPALYICRGTACAAPVTVPEGILAALQSIFQAAPPGLADA
ncbi:MAG: DUF255 domain-containing protein [Thermaerobacter sp.]|nr:DUF255 domain-containing protein [Thermaerobacter sp.]